MMNIEHFHCDLVIVGAGPAGLSAAKVAADNGLKVILLDEFPTAGGRMVGQYHEEPKKGWWVGKNIAQDLIRANQQLGVDIRCGQSVHGLDQLENGWKVLLPHASIQTKFLLLATGAAEIPVPIPGWTLPGVMSIGAAQVMTNVHYVKPGTRGIIIGVNVLAMAIARELAISGVQLAGIVLPFDRNFNPESTLPLNAFQLLTGLSQLSPSAGMRFGGSMVNRFQLASKAIHFFPKKGVHAWGIPIQLRTAAVAIHGENQVQSVTLVDLDGHGKPIPRSEREEKVDFVAIAGGLYPLVELASVAGCKFVHIPELGGYIPLHSEALRTPLPSLYVAGNITGVESASVAMAQGLLAAASICNDAGVFGTDGTKKEMEAIQHVKHVRSAALIQFHPGIEAARHALYEQYQSMI